MVSRFNIFQSKASSWLVCSTKKRSFSCLPLSFLLQMVIIYYFYIFCFVYNLVLHSIVALAWFDVPYLVQIFWNSYLEELSISFCICRAPWLVPYFKLLINPLLHFCSLFSFCLLGFLGSTIVDSMHYRVYLSYVIPYIQVHIKLHILSFMSCSICWRTYCVLYLKLHFFSIISWVPYKCSISWALNLEFYTLHFIVLHILLKLDVNNIFFVVNPTLHLKIISLPSLFRWSSVIPFPIWIFFLGLYITQIAAVVLYTKYIEEMKVCLDWDP